MAQTEEFMFQNVAYRPTVYKTGAGGDKQKQQLGDPLNYSERFFSYKINVVQHTHGMYVSFAQ